MFGGSNQGLAIEMNRYRLSRAGATWTKQPLASRRDSGGPCSLPQQVGPIRTADQVVAAGIGQDMLAWQVGSNPLEIGRQPLGAALFVGFAGVVLDQVDHAMERVAPGRPAPFEGPRDGPVGDQREGERAERPEQDLGEDGPHVMSPRDFRGPERQR